MPPGKIRKTNGKNYLQKLNRTQLMMTRNMKNSSTYDLDCQIFLSIGFENAGFFAFYYPNF